MLRGDVVDDAGVPLAGVVVSDGFVVARTAQDGSFAFDERADAEFVFVTVPTAYGALEGRWFARIGDELRFVLRRRAEVPTTCRFVQVTDLHVSVDNGAEMRPLIESGTRAPDGIAITLPISGDELRADLLAVIARERPDFIAATGDLADGGRAAELVAYRDAIDGIGVPVASLPGNHDHLSVLSQASIDAFFATWTPRDEGDSPGAAFQREVFGGDWRRANSGRAPWRDTIGPLYYSFDWAGVHFVAYDGEGLRRYGTDYPQDAWLAADLATVAPHTPVVVLTHFPEEAEFFAARFGSVRLVASFSGHWHGLRVWHDGGASHWTSSTLGFGGIDYTPRGYRVVEIQGGEVHTRWTTFEDAATERVTAAVALDGERVAVARMHADTRGVITTDAWTCELPAATRNLAFAEGLVCSLDLSGELRALAAGSGDVVWSARLGPRSTRWTHSAPVVDGDTVYAGSPMSIHAFDLATGGARWRTNISHHETAASLGMLAVAGDRVVVGAVNDDLHLAALDAHTGAVAWKRDGRDIGGVSATPVVVGDLVVAARAPGWLVAYALEDGSPRWRAPLDDAWPVAVAATDEVAFVRSATGTVSAHALADGACLFTARLGPGPRAARPYSRDRGGERQPLVVVAERLWTAVNDELVALDVATGTVVERRSVGDEIASVLQLGDRVVAVTHGGGVV